MMSIRELNGHKNQQFLDRTHRSVFQHLLLPHWEKNRNKNIIFTAPTRQHNIFSCLSSLALVFFLNPSCPDQPSCREAAYVTSLSGALCVVASRIQNIQPELFDLLLFWTLMSEQMMKIYGAQWEMSKQRLTRLRCFEFDRNAAMTDEEFTQPPLLQEEVVVVQRQIEKVGLLCWFDVLRGDETSRKDVFGTVRSPKRHFQHPISKSVQRSKVDTDL